MPPIVTSAEIERPAVEVFAYATDPARRPSRCPGHGRRDYVPAARDALEAAACQRGWITERIHDSDTFCRMVIRSADSGVLIDLAVNAPPDLPASTTPAGPTLAPEELAGNKLLALFDRAAARDFADVYVLARRCPLPVTSRVKSYPFAGMTRLSRSSG